MPCIPSRGKGRQRRSQQGEIFGSSLLSLGLAPAGILVTSHITRRIVIQYADTVFFFALSAVAPFVMTIRGRNALQAALLGALVIPLHAIMQISTPHRLMLYLLQEGARFGLSHTMVAGLVLVFGSLLGGFFSVVGAALAIVWSILLHKRLMRRS